MIDFLVHFLYLAHPPFIATSKSQKPNENVLRTLQRLVIRLSIDGYS